MDRMRLRRRARAGLYAHDKYERGLRAYRERTRWPLVVGVAPFFVFVLVVMGTRKLDPWSLVVGAAMALGIALVMFVRDELVPQHILNWKRGAEGERRTEKALRRLERKGWTVDHDIQRDGRANLDHVVAGPSRRFLLETKNLAGTVSFEDGVLVARQLDDPDEVFRYSTLAGRVRGQAMELSQRLQAETGRRTWVDAVVVIWGYFPAGKIEGQNVTYIHGDQLVDWLWSREPKLISSSRLSALGRRRHRVAGSRTAT